MFKLIFVKKSNNSFIQFFRYAIVGGIASIVDIGGFNAGVALLGLNHIIANSLSFILGLLVNYFLSRDWVFNKKKHIFARDFFIFSIIGIIGLVISNCILYALIDCHIINSLTHLENTNLIAFSAKLVAVTVTLVWNFFARKKLVFDTSTQRSKAEQN